MAAFLVALNDNGALVRAESIASSSFKFRNDHCSPTKRNTVQRCTLTVRVVLRVSVYGFRFFSRWHTCFHSILLNVYILFTRACIIFELRRTSFFDQTTCMDGSLLYPMLSVELLQAPHGSIKTSYISFYVLCSRRDTANHTQGSRIYILVQVLPESRSKFLNNVRFFCLLEKALRSFLKACRQQGTINSIHRC